VQQDVPDHLQPGLKLVIVGINPGIQSGAKGHHYAFPGNQFWPLLYDSGILPERLTWAEDERVLEYGIGLTNLVDRTSRSSSDLTRDEMRAGAEVLREKLLRFRPKVVCFNGMGIYEAFSGRKKLTLGLQEETLDGILLFVVPSSSGRTAAYQRPLKLQYYLQLKELVDRVASSPADAQASGANHQAPQPIPATDEAIA
jgi:TDG/mug DNA glycosylase family protein